jgi:hypothetical protein
MFTRKYIIVEKSQLMQRNLEYLIYWNYFRKLKWDDTSCDNEWKYIIPQVTNKISLCEIIKELEAITDVMKSEPED